MDETHLLAAPRYVVLNPVRARLAARAEDWRWSSIHAYLGGRDDGLTRVEPVLARCPRFADFVAAPTDPKDIEDLRRAESIGRPLGDEAFLAQLEALTRRSLRPGKRGPKAGHDQNLPALQPSPGLSPQFGKLL